METPGPVPKHWLKFGYIHLEDYELDQNFDYTEYLEKSNHTSNDKAKLFRKSIVVIEEEWFDDTNLTNSATFPTDLIKCEKLGSIKK